MATRIAYWTSSVSGYPQVSDSSAGKTSIAQQFTIDADYNIVSVVLLMKRLNTATTLTAAIYDRDNGNPFISLGSKTIDISGWSTTASDKTIGFDTPISVTAGNYAIVLTEGSNWSSGWGKSTAGSGSGALQLVSGTWSNISVPASSFYFEVYAEEETTYVNISGSVTGTSSLSGALVTSDRLNPPSQTYWYDDGAGTSFYYRLWVQSDGSYGDSPANGGTENIDYEVLAGYLPNFINTNRRLVAVTRNSIYYEDI